MARGSRWTRRDVLQSAGAGLGAAAMPFAAARGAIQGAPLSLAAGARVAAVGDSLVGYNNYGGSPVKGGGVSSYAYGFVEWARALDPRFDFDSWFDPADPTGRNIAGANQGVFGDHLVSGSAGILGRLPAVLARKPDLLILEGGTNTINSGDAGAPGTTGYVTGKLDAALALARNAGVPVILMTLFPRGDWPAGDQRYRTLKETNEWIRAQAGREGVAAVCDAWETLTTGGAQNPARFFTDKAHLNALGAFMVGRDCLLPVMRSLIGEGSIFDQDPTVANLFSPSQARMEGKDGGRLGSPEPTGHVATGFTLRAGARNFKSIACSKAVSGGLEAQVLEIAPADTYPGAAYCEIGLALPVVPAPTPAPGKWYRFAAKIDLGGGASVSCTRSSLVLYGDRIIRAQNVTMQCFSSDFATGLPADRSFWIVSNPLTVPEGGTPCDRIAASVGAAFGKTSEPFRMTISRPILREVEDPRAAWGY